MIWEPLRSAHGDYADMIAAILRAAGAEFELVTYAAHAGELPAQPLGQRDLEHADAEAAGAVTVHHEGRRGDDHEARLGGAAGEGGEQQRDDLVAAVAEHDGVGVAAVALGQQLAQAAAGAVGVAPELDGLQAAAELGHDLGRPRLGALVGVQAGAGADGRAVVDAEAGEGGAEVAGPGHRLLRGTGCKGQVVRDRS